MMKQEKNKSKPKGTSNIQVGKTGIILVSNNIPRTDT